MRYVHWLKINGYVDCEETAKQFQKIENYLKSYPKQMHYCISTIVVLLIGL